MNDKDRTLLNELHDDGLNELHDDGLNELHDDVQLQQAMNHVGIEIRNESCETVEIKIDKELTLSKKAVRKSFYQKYFKPIYKEKPGATDLVPYYGNGTFSKITWIILNIVLAMVILLVIITPITYFFIFPNFLQYCIEEIGIDGHTIKIYKQAVGNFTDNSLFLSADLRFTPWSILPIPGGFGANTMEIVTLGDEKRLVSISVPSAKFMLNEEIRLDTDAHITWDQEQQDNVQNILTRLSSRDGIKDFGLKIKLNAPVQSMGMTIYPSLSLHRDIPLGDVSFATIVKAALSTAPVVNPGPPVVKLINKESDHDAALHSHFNADEITTLPDNLGGMDLVWKSFDTKIDDAALGASLGLAFENLSPLSLNPIQFVELYVALNGTRVAKLKLENLSLESGLNTNFLPSASIQFIDDKIDLEKVQTAIEDASHAFATTFDIGLSIMGPIKISNAEFVEKVTSELNVGVTLSQLLSLAPSSLLNLLQHPPSLNLSAGIPPQLKGVLGNSSLKLSVGNEKVESTFSLNLPALSFIKPPKNISLPFTTSFSIYASNNKVIDFQTLPITVTTSPSGISISAGLDIVPVNSDQAASSLAESINPILALSPRNSSIGIKDLFFYPSMGNGTFRTSPCTWSKELFGKRALNIELAPIDKSAFIDTLISHSGTISKATSELFQIVIPGPISVSQLRDQPGFGLSAFAKVKVKPNFPTVSLDLGYLNLDTRVSDSVLASVRLPSGLKWTDSAESDIAVTGHLIIARSDNLDRNVQSFLDAFLTNGAQDSSVGISGIAFGSSLSNHIVTFSKLVADVDANFMKKALKRVSSGAGYLPLPPLSKGMVKINSASLEIPFVNSISSKIDATIHNPTSISLDLGAISIDSYLNGKKLSGVNLAAIKLDKGTGPLSLGLDLTPSTGANGLSQDVAGLIDAIMRMDASFDFPIEISGMQIVPSGISSGPAVIDQFKNVRIGSLTKPLLSMILENKSNGSRYDILDFSDILNPLQDKNLVSNFAPDVKYVQLLQQPSSHINAGLDLAYRNPLPISALFSYLAFDLVLDGSDAVSLGISSVQLSRQSGYLQPRISLAFQQGLADKVSKLIQGVLSGKLESKISVKNIRFGGTANSNNDLVSLVSLDLSSMASSVIASLGPKLQAQLNSAGASVSIEKRDGPSSNASRDLVLKGPFGSRLTLTKLEVELKADKSLSTGIGANMVLPFIADINLPYFAVSVGVDRGTVVDISTGLAVSGQGTSTTAINARLQFHDDDFVTEKISEIVNAAIEKKPIPGSLVIHGIKVGSSPQDSSDVLSRVSLAVSIDKLLSRKPWSSPSGSFDILPLVQSFSPSLSNINFQMLPNRKVSLDVGLGLTMPFPVTLKGLGYITAAVSVNQDDLIVLSASSIAIQPGNQSLQVKGEAFFPSVSSTSKDKLAGFVDHVFQNNRDSSQSDTISLHQIRFGFDSHNSINILSKARISVTANRMLDLMGSSLSTSLDQAKKSLNNLVDQLSSHLSTVFVKKIKLDTMPDSSISSQLVAGLSQSNVKANVAIGYSSLSLLVDSYRLLDFSLSSPLVIGTEGNTVTASISNSLSVSSEIGLQETVSDIAQKISSDKLEQVGNTIGVTGIEFGPSNQPNDIIDTFSKIKIFHSLKPILKSLLSNLQSRNQTLALPDSLKNIKVTPRKVELDVVDEETLSTDLEASISGIDTEIDVSIPLLYGSLKINQDEFLSNQIKSLRIQNNKISASVLVVFPESNQVRSAIQNVFADIGNILWGVTGQVSSRRATLYGAGMGYSTTSKVSLLEKVPLEANVESILSNTAKSGLGVSMMNLDVSLEHEGIRILATASDLGFPIVLKNSIKSESKWAVGGTMDPSKFTTLMHVTGPPLTLPRAAVLLTPPAQVSDMVPPMREALVKLLTWESYGENVRLGFLTLTGSNGKVFSRFDSAWFGGPTWLTAPPKFNIDSDFEKPYTPVDPGLNPIYFATTISVINNTPLHLNAGALEMYSESYDPMNPKGYHEPDPDSIILELLCDRDLIVRNWNEGGNATSQAGPPTQALFHGTLIAFGYLDWRALFETAFALDPQSHQPNYRTILRTKRDGKYIKWFDDFNYAMEDSHFTALLLPFFDKIATHLQYHSDIPSSL